MTTHVLLRPSLALIVALLASAAQAHFPWLATDDQGRPLLYFSEGPAERDYHLPEAIAVAKVRLITDDSAREVELPSLEEDDFIGRRSSDSVEAGVLQTTKQYGVYGDSLLTYYARHYVKLDSQAHPKVESLPLDLQVVWNDDSAEVRVQWQGKPLTDAMVTLADLSDEQPQVKTDPQGRAIFKDVPAGLVGFLVGHTDDSVQGELDGAKYRSAAHYATVTFHRPDPKAEEAAKNLDATKQSVLPALPEGIASFGAAVCQGQVYVYSGHTGVEHDHSRENLSRGFFRTPLSAADSIATWESLPMQSPLQGLALVAHEGCVIRVGGMQATNAPGEDQTLYSVAEVACFDVEFLTWRAMPDLPEPRSSHDAVVIGQMLYVVGGWKLSGEATGEWVNTAWSLDLSSPSSAWQPISGPPFQRRALSLASWQGKLVALGGMDEKRKVSSRVDCYDPATKTWSQLADLPGKGMRGFGASAWGLPSGLYASAAEGIVYRLADDGQNWSETTKLQSPRFFHRLMPDSEGNLLAIGGAAEEGHLGTTERVLLKP